MTDYHAQLMKELGLLRIADAVYDGTRLPLLVIDEQREWPWEPPTRIETTGAILAALRSTELLLPLEIDGRQYHLEQYDVTRNLHGRDEVDRAIWELGTEMRSRSWIAARDAWDAWHFPRPWEQRPSFHERVTEPTAT